MKIEKQLTAVEWLESNLIHTPEYELHFKHNEECWQQAKEMENKATFEQAVKPLMKWLCENAHPHTTAIVDGTLAQLVEGVESVKTEEFLVD